MNGRHKFNPAQFDANMSSLPELAYAIHMMDGSVIIIKKGESGFYPIDTAKFPQAVAEPEAFVAQQNTAMGVRPSQAQALFMGSLFGWDLPGANPETYRDLDLIADLDAVDPALGQRAREMKKGGASYDAIFAHFKDLFEQAKAARIADGVPA